MARHDYYVQMETDPWAISGVDMFVICADDEQEKPHPVVEQTRNQSDRYLTYRIKENADRALPKVRDGGLPDAYVLDKKGHTAPEPDEAPPEKSELPSDDPSPGPDAPDTPEDGSAVRITVHWDDGIRHEWNRLPDGSWDLELSGPEFGYQRISGYKREDMNRVIGTALKGTPQ